MFLFSSDLGIKDPTVKTWRALVVVISRGGSSRLTECVKLPFSSTNSADGKPAVLKRTDLVRRFLMQHQFCISKAQCIFTCQKNERGVFKDKRWNPVGTRKRTIRPCGASWSLHSNVGGLICGLFLCLIWTLLEGEKREMTIAGAPQQMNMSSKCFCHSSEHEVGCICQEINCSEEPSEDI